MCGASGGSQGESEGAALVRTPGGLRPGEHVHWVAPGEAVRIDETGKPVIVRQKEEAQMAEELVLTPGGFRPASLVHLIEPGHSLDGSDGRLRKLDPSV